MFNWFKKKPVVVVEKTPAVRLQEQLITTQVVTAAVKKEFYHEIIPIKTEFKVKVYNRKSGALVEETQVKTKDNAIDTALSLLAKYNKGVV